MATATQDRSALELLIGNVESVIRGKSDVVRLAVVSLLARGHILFEDVPGVGKTTLGHCLALSVSCQFSRIQFTSDLLPSDILGVTIFDPAKRAFEFHPGPLFANIVLADEINRTTPKTQSSLLEAMNTARVSVDKTTYTLPQPFVVIATQNPIEFHGTFPLPKSQMDRFMMRLSLGYPEAVDERRILREQKTLNVVESIKPAVSAETVLRMQREVEEVQVEESILDYIVRISRATRESPRIELGVSIRGSLALRRASQALAYCDGRDFVAPDDVKELAIPTLAHRIQAARTFENASQDDHEESAILRDILAETPSPI